MTKAKREIRIGCSGWNYKHWKVAFYPTDLPLAGWLRYYATHFDSVEINNTFYRLPEASTFAAWREQTPKSFLFAVKASRYLTHLKRLRDPAEPVSRLFQRARALGTRLGPVLYQLPGHFHIDLARLEQFLEILPRRIRVLRAAGGGAIELRHAMEFRHRSWYTNETYQLLDKHRVALCLHDKHDSAIHGPFVGPFIYVRFHGTTGNYRGSYDGRTLGDWGHRLAEQWQDGREVFAYFNNDVHAAAIENAQELRKRITRLLNSARPALA